MIRDRLQNNKLHNYVEKKKTLTSWLPAAAESTHVDHCFQSPLKGTSLIPTRQSKWACASQRID